MLMRKPIIAIADDDDLLIQTGMSSLINILHSSEIGRIMPYLNPCSCP